LVVYLRVRIYVDKVQLIRCPVTLHHYYLQLRENLLDQWSGSNSVSEERCWEMAALALQADHASGDLCNEQNFRAEQYFPLWVINLRGLDFVRRNMPAMRRDLRQCSRVDATLEYCHEASRSPFALNCHLYGLRRHKMDTIDNAIIGITPRGIDMSDVGNDGERIPLRSCRWDQMTKLCFDKRKLSITGVDGACVSLYAQSDQKARYLLEFCKALHQAQIAFNRHYLMNPYAYRPDVTSPFSCGDERSVDGPICSRRSLLSHTSSNSTSGVVSDKPYSDADKEGECSGASRVASECSYEESSIRTQSLSDVVAEIERRSASLMSANTSDDDSSTEIETKPTKSINDTTQRDQHHHQQQRPQQQQIGTSLPSSSSQHNTMSVCRTEFLSFSRFCPNFFVTGIVLAINSDRSNFLLKTSVESAQTVQSVKRADQFSSSSATVRETIDQHQPTEAESRKPSIGTHSLARQSASSADSGEITTSRIEKRPSTDSDSSSAPPALPQSLPPPLFPSATTLQYSAPVLLKLPTNRPWKIASYFPVLPVGTSETDAPVANAQSVGCSKTRSNSRDTSDVALSNLLLANNRLGIRQPPHYNEAISITSKRTSTATINDEYHSAQHRPNVNPNQKPRWTTVTGTGIACAADCITSRCANDGSISNDILSTCSPPLQHSDAHLARSEPKLDQKVIQLITMVSFLFSPILSYELSVCMHEPLLAYKPIFKIWSRPVSPLVSMSPSSMAPVIVASARPTPSNTPPFPGGTPIGAGLFQKQSRSAFRVASQMHNNARGINRVQSMPAHNPHHFLQSSGESEVSPSSAAALHHAHSLAARPVALETKQPPSYEHAILQARARCAHRVSAPNSVNSCRSVCEHELLNERHSYTMDSNDNVEDLSLNSRIGQFPMMRALWQEQQKDIASGVATNSSLSVTTTNTSAQTPLTASSGSSGLDRLSFSGCTGDACSSMSSVCNVDLLDSLFTPHLRRPSSCQDLSSPLIITPPHSAPMHPTTTSYINNNPSSASQQLIQPSTLYGYGYFPTSAAASTYGIRTTQIPPPPIYRGEYYFDHSPLYRHYVPLQNATAITQNRYVIPTYCISFACISPLSVLHLFHAFTYLILSPICLSCWTPSQSVLDLPPPPPYPPPRTSPSPREAPMVM
uniref:Protein expanded (inferred by orthology to a D. melanogaster protein) n=1 Tax=Anisakis simplex TaxID=6269 RepID=A0A0M3K4V0_ANISI